MIFSSKVKIKYSNVMIDEKKNFHQPIKSDLRTYDNIRKVVTGYTTECLLDYPYFEENYKIIAID